MRGNLRNRLLSSDRFYGHLRLELAEWLRLGFRIGVYPLCPDQNPLIPVSEIPEPPLIAPADRDELTREVWYSLLAAAAKVLFPEAS